jgi:UDP-2,3-diacylglucosamine hydrolase
MTILVVSDVHLAAPTPAISEQFHAFLATEARQATALYILGDLFELWIGDDDIAATDSHDPLWQTLHALRALSDAGTALYFMHGNRDFLLGADFCALTGGSMLIDPTVVEYAGRRALLTHGDALCVDDIPYQRLRALVRDPTWQHKFLSLPLATRAALARDARADSASHTRTQNTMLMDVNPAAVAHVFREAQVDLLIHGHTHRPGVHTDVIDGRTCTRIVTGDWYSQGSVLRWDTNGLVLETRARSSTLTPLNWGNPNESERLRRDA